MCQNGAGCVLENTAMKCICTTGFIGDLCEIRETGKVAILHVFTKHTNVQSSYPECENRFNLHFVIGFLFLILVSAAVELSQDGGWLGGGGGVIKRTCHGVVGAT